MNPNITISETRDVELVWRIVSDPAIIDRWCDDVWIQKVPEMQHLVKCIVENPATHIILVCISGEPVGVFMGYPMPGNVLDVHTFMSEKCRGRDAIQAGRMAVQYVLSLPDVEKLESLCPENMKETLFYALVCGWHKAGVSATKWLKNGIEYAMQKVEMTKMDLKPTTN